MKRASWLCLWLTVLASAALARETPRELIQQGNDHYRAARFAEALKCYEAAGAAAQSPELLHNQAAAHFKLGEIDTARDLWVRLKNAPDPQLEARTRYNLGNCDYAQALAAAGQNPQQALELLKQAGLQYREALRVDAKLADARANLELAQLLKKQIEEQLQQQPQSQCTTDQGQKDPNQSQSKPSSQPSSKPSEQDQQQSEDQQQSQQQEPQEQRERQEQAEKSQEQQEDQQEKQGEEDQQPSDGEPNQPQATTMPAESQPADPNQGQQTVEIQMTREQAERLLQMIRDAEKLRRKKQAQQRAAKSKPVERDW